MFLAIEASLL